MAGGAMMELSNADVLNAAYKLRDWLNFYWNFYVAFSGIVIGWVFSSKGWSNAQRVMVSLFYLAFVCVSIIALYNTYVSLESAAQTLEAKVNESDAFAKILVGYFQNPLWKVQLGMHLAGDCLIVFCIWRFTQKQPQPAGLAAPV
jgi:hypothetical protein